MYFLYFYTLCAYWHIILMGIDTAKVLMIMNQRNISIYKMTIYSGLEHSTISRILSGKRSRPRIDTVVKIARSLNLTIDEILLRD
jgi:transcriptional regulator with XRE-family HTH domain